MMNLKRLGWGVSMSPGYDQTGSHFGFVFSDRSQMESADEALKAQGIPVTEFVRAASPPLQGWECQGNGFEYLYEPST